MTCSARLGGTSAFRTSWISPRRSTCAAGTGGAKRSTGSDGTRDLLARHGKCPTITEAGTSSFEFEAEDRAIVDAGLKALAFDSGSPIVCDEPAATYERASDEHGRLAVSAATNRLGLGDKIRLIPGHCDPTVNLYDWYVCMRGNRVEQVWPITARGAVY
jgi:hypothetical protein